jgi:hypothetical protein
MVGICVIRIDRPFRQLRPAVPDIVNVVHHALWSGELRDIICIVILPTRSSGGIHHVQLTTVIVIAKRRVGSGWIVHQRQVIDEVVAVVNLLKHSIDAPGLVSIVLSLIKGRDIGMHFYNSTGNGFKYYFILLG